jgi:para-aminobenzoate synthetase / 4-amino-4-deoxychorismate lyase
VVAVKAWIDFVAPEAGRPAVRAAFEAPLHVLQAQHVSEVKPLLEAVEQAAQAGHWCVGYVRYEAAPAFDAAFQVQAQEAQSSIPLAWFGVFDAPALCSELSADSAHASWGGELPRPDFDAVVDRIHQAIAQGRYYQLNFTHVLQGQLAQGTPWALFAALRRAQPGAYSAFIDSGHEQVLCVSPELFFDWNGERLLTRPMKGTAPRGATEQADQAHAQALRQSDKERAENVMIVDLLRNDVSRIAQLHSVKVPNLFALEALPSVWQMTSDVTAQTQAGIRLVDVFGALFPCGSITGAPKVEAMRHIAEIEAGPRGVYCGAVGVVRPGAQTGQVDATFNVAIRTVVARSTEAGTELACGIGSGITTYAQAEGEWQEWQHKRAFLDRASQPFDLLETVGLHQGQVRHLELHLNRMADAALHFGYPFDRALVHAAFMQTAQAHPQGAWRLRLLLQPNGQPTVQAFALAATPEPVVLALADRSFDAAHTEFVRYKTTRRAHYEAFEPTDPGVFDTLLWNNQHELTECTRGNVALLIDGQWLTPALQSGLLNGVGRQHWLAQGRIQEAVLYTSDLPRAQGLVFMNSLRGWLEARLVHPKP